MASLSFYIFKRVNNPIKTIYYSLSHNGKQYRFSSGLRIYEKDWDTKKNFLKSTARRKEHIIIRKKLIDLVNFVSVECIAENPNITFDQLKYKFLEKIGKYKVSNPDEPVNLIEAHQMYAKRMESHRHTVQTVNRFKRNATLLEMFFNDYRYSPDIRTYTEEQKKRFLDQFVEFLAYKEKKNRFGEVIKKRYENATVKKCLEVLKAVVEYYDWPLMIKMKKVFPHKIFTVTDGDAIHFTTEEVMFLYRYDPGNKYLKEVLDMLVFCAFTGLRHGELPHVKKSGIEQRKNINGENYYVFRRYSPKERNTNYIPLNSVCREIVDKYTDYLGGDVLFPVKTNVYCNRELHKMMKKADPMFHKTYKRVRHIGTELKEENIPRWKALTFHAARHHYSYYLRKIGLGIDDAAVMLNHKDKDTTARFYRHESVEKIVEETFNRMSEAES